MSGEDEIALAMAELTADYASTLDERLAALRGALETAPGDDGSRHEAKRLAHKLHGTAATYGFRALGDAAGELEAALDSKTPDWTRIAALTALLRR